LSILGFYFDVVKALEEIGARYMLIGAFAGSGYGISRATFDIDMLVDLHEPHFDLLAGHFPLPRYYADPEQMRSSTRMGIMFNIIDTNQGVKADIMPLTGSLDYRHAFSHRIRRSFRDEAGEEFQAWCARPEDIIVGKLMAWAEGKSFKHPTDIHDILLFHLSGLSDIVLDLDYITAQAKRLGTDTETLWDELIFSAKTESDKWR